MKSTNWKIEPPGWCERMKDRAWVVSGANIGEFDDLDAGWFVIPVVFWRGL